MENAQSNRSNPLPGSKSFTRFDSSTQSTRHRSRASTVGATVSEPLFPQSIMLSPESEERAGRSDIFSTNDGEDSGEAGLLDADSIQFKGPITLDVLPIEIRSMTERFLDSLSAKVHPTPLSVDALSELFQDFYSRASSQISTHTATLQSRVAREMSPARSVSSKHSGKSAASGRKGSGSAGAEQQMLTASEVFDRKKARRRLELKRLALEEAVERLVCEKLYERLWRHRSTEDEERDHKLRSRTAALSLLGIGLKELLVSADEDTSDARHIAAENEADMKKWLSEARTCIQQMDDEKYPLGKLQHLSAAHKSIVETLSRLFPASSSADEILPTLIYTLISCPPENLNVISNLHFIQRFRTTGKIDGEAAYCLVNLEAAISFLETVDLSSLKIDETAELPQMSQTGPMNLGLEQTPSAVQPDTATFMPPLTPLLQPDTPPGAITVLRSPVVATTKPLPATPTTKSQRRLSNLIQAQTNRIEAASDAVRESILDGADQALESISSTLESSYKFLFGRLREQQNTKAQTGGNTENLIPKTLEDARKLVSSPTLAQTEEDANTSATSSVIDHPLEDRGHEAKESVLSDLFGGKRLPRERSVDSNKSTGSGRRVGGPDHRPAPVNTAAANQLLSTTPPTPSAIESMRNLGNSLNPLNRLSSINPLSNINPLSRFGRSSTSQPIVPTQSTVGVTSTPSSEKNKQLGDADPAPEAKAMAVLEELKKTQPPIRKFLEAVDAKDLRIGEIEDLLKDYQRLAMALRTAINAAKSVS